MNKTGCALVVGLLVVCVNARAMENAVIEEAKDVGKAVINTIKNETAESTRQAFCWTCPVKNACMKALAFCKGHPVSLAIGVAVVTAAIIYKTIPAVKEQVNALLGIDTADQTESFDADNHELPQEQIEVPEII